MNNRRFICLSASANETEQLMGAGHELVHDFFDWEEERKNEPQQDTWFYSLSYARQEKRVNLFSTEPMVPDEAVLKPIGYYSLEKLLEEERRKHPNCSEEQLQQYAILEFQARSSDVCTTEEIAREHGVNPVLIEFKYKALLKKGFHLPISPELSNDYLKK